MAATSTVASEARGHGQHRAASVDAATPRLLVAVAAAPVIVTPAAVVAVASTGFRRSPAPSAVAVDLQPRLPPRIMSGGGAARSHYPTRTPPLLPRLRSFPPSPRYPFQKRGWRRSEGGATETVRL